MCLRVLKRVYRRRYQCNQCVTQLGCDENRAGNIGPNVEYIGAKCEKLAATCWGLPFKGILIGDVLSHVSNWSVLVIEPSRASLDYMQEMQALVTCLSPHQRNFSQNCKVFSGQC